MYLYTGTKKYKHPCYIIMIEMRILWKEIEYLESVARLFNRDLVNRRGLYFSKAKEVLWVSEGQKAVELTAIKVGAWRSKKNSAARPGIDESDSKWAEWQNCFFLPLSLTAGTSAALWLRETHSTFLERSKPLLLTYLCPRVKQYF